MFKLLLMRQTLFDFDVLLPRSCVALAFFRFFQKKQKQKSRKMFLLSLSQEVLVEPTCPQAKI